MSRGRDSRYAAFMALAVILILILAFFVYNHGSVHESLRHVPHGAEEPFPGFPVDINSADVEALRLLPGIGTRTAEAIIAERQKKGDFASIEDIRNVRGIGERTFEAIKGFIVIKKHG